MAFYEFRCQDCGNVYIGEVRPGQPGFIPCGRCGGEKIARSPMVGRPKPEKKSKPSCAGCGSFG